MEYLKFDWNLAEIKWKIWVSEDSVRISKAEQENKKAELLKEFEIYLGMFEELYRGSIVYKWEIEKPSKEQFSQFMCDKAYEILLDKE